MLRKALFVVVLVGMVLSLSACAGNNVMETARNTAQELFVKDGPGGMTRPEAAAFWAAEWAKIDTCAAAMPKVDGKFAIVVSKDAKQFSFKGAAEAGRAECGMWRPWSPILMSLKKGGVVVMYSESNLTAALP